MPEAPGAKFLWGAVALLLVITGWFAGLHLWSSGTRDDFLSRSAAIPLAVVPDCDVARNRCLAKDASIAVYLRLGSLAATLEPFPVEVTVQTADGAAPSRVEIEFLMSGMDMGINRYRLDAGEDGQWLGRAILPVCTTGRRDWLAVVNVVMGERTWQAGFPFTVRRGESGVSVFR